MKRIIWLWILALPLLAAAQKNVRKNVREGNSQFEKERYSEADVAYRKALEENPNSPEANANLATTMYKQNKFKEAAEQYQAAFRSITSPEHAFPTWHNLGNTYMQLKDYAKSVDAYKQALKINPSDNETRYNLALAQALLKNQQNQDKNKDKNKDKDKDKQKKDQKDKDKDKKDQQNKDQQNKDKQDQQKQQQQNPNQMSKENAKQMLDAFMQDEKGTQDRVKQMQLKQRQQRKTSKEW